MAGMGERAGVGERDGTTEGKRGGEEEASKQARRGAVRPDDGTVLAAGSSSMIDEMTAAGDWVSLVAAVLPAAG